MKLSINIPDELLARIDVYAKETYINRTSAFCVLLTTALNGNDITRALASSTQSEG